MKKNDNIFIYTISDFKNKASECIDMAFQPFLNKKKENISLSVIANKYPDKPVDERVKIIIDNDANASKYIGFLKYSEKIPDGYSHYFYIDSDILLFGDEKKLINEKYDYTIVQEDWVKMSHEWHCYKYRTEEEFKKMQNLNGINAGTFGFKDTAFLKFVRDLYCKDVTDNLIKNAMLEQSSLNYAICKKLDFNLENAFNITNKACFFAQDKKFDKKKILYHFNGFSNQMESKYQMMKNFLNEKSSI
jgi:hypothetical protein